MNAKFRAAQSGALALGKRGARALRREVANVRSGQRPDEEPGREGSDGTFDYFEGAVPAQSPRTCFKWLVMSAATAFLSPDTIASRIG